MALNNNPTPNEVVKEVKNLDSNKLSKSGGTMTGTLNLANKNSNIGSNGIRWDGTSLPEDEDPAYLCTIESFASGGRQKWTKFETLKTKLNVPTITMRWY